MLAIINDYINQLMKSMNMSRQMAIQTTKRAIQRQLKQNNKVTFEVSGKRQDFSKEEIISIWNKIK